MLLNHQRRTANLIGIAIGLVVLAIVLLSHAPSGASPTLGAAVDVTTQSGRQITPDPVTPQAILATDNLQPGAPAIEGTVTLTSRREDPAEVQLELSPATQLLIPDLPFTSVLEISFGKDGMYGTTTVAQMADSGVPTISINPGETIQVPVSVSLPISAGDQSAGQQLSIGLVPNIKETPQP